jgi:Flp pilus assembly protein TadD
MLLVAASAAVAFFLWYRFIHIPLNTNRFLAPPLAPALPILDPRLSYSGPFKNVHPDIACIDDAVCADCHVKEAKTFSRHPMARTLIPIDRNEPLPLDHMARNPFEAFGQRFEVLKREGRIRHVRSALDSKGKPLFEQELPVDFAVGSGTHAHSFAFLRGSTVLQTPITWFAQNKSDRFWALSPGFVPNVLAGRRIGADCLYCHSNGANEDPDDETTYRQPIFPYGHGIGCQRCHGPGAEHVKEPGIVQTPSGMLDPTIVNPAHLTHSLREAVCWQCHLEGEVRVLRRGRQRYDFRPGMPLEDFVGVYEDVKETSFEQVNNHVEQMVQSRCYQKRTGTKQMGCVSCHDPHEKPAPDRKVAWYRSACLKCHEEHGCSLPLKQRIAQLADDSCIVCHMPAFRTSNVVHVSSTDHRIPRKPLPRKTNAPPGMRSGPIKDLVSLFEAHRVKNDPEVDRDRALAAALLARRGRKLIHPLDKELAEAARRDPGDLAVKAQYAIALIQQGNAAAALPVMVDVLARQPSHEWGLFGHAIACMQLGRVEESIASWQRLIELVPAHGGYRNGLIELLMKESRWEEAQRAAQSWVAADPGFPTARQLLSICLMQLGKVAEATEQERIFRELAHRMGAAP